MPRRGDNIRKRTDGRWEGRYPAVSADGERRYLSVYGKSYGEVKEKMTAKTDSSDFPAIRISDRQQICDTDFAHLWKNGWKRWSRVENTLLILSIKNFIPAIFVLTFFKTGFPE